jgi:hypothetical protein
MQARTLFIRRCDRRPIVLPARCRSRTGFVNHVVITDLSPDGCRIESRGLTLVADDLVTLRPEGLESLVGVVRWRGNRQAGIEFEQPLYLPVVEHLARLHASFLPPPSQYGAMPLHRAA